MAIEWWKQIEARDRYAAELSNRYVEQMKALQRQRQERENRERDAERAHEPPVGMPMGWRPPALR
jgi:hypothetical protein